MNNDGIWGGHLELHGCARRFGVVIQIYQQNGPDFRVEPEGQPAAIEQMRIIRIGYLNRSHYVSVRHLSELGVAVPQQTRRTVELSSEDKKKKIKKMQEYLGVENQKIITQFLESTNYAVKRAVALFQEHQIREMEELLNEFDSEQVSDFTYHSHAYKHTN